MIRVLAIWFSQLLALWFICAAPGWAQPQPQEPPAGLNQAGEIPALIPTKAFAGRSSFWGAELSPDGNTLTLFQSVKDKLQLTAIDPRTREAMKGVTFGEGNFVEWTRWVDNDRMLINVMSIAYAYGVALRTTRLFIVYPKEGRAVPLIDDQRGFSGGELLHVSKDKQSVLIAHGPPDDRGRGRRGFMRAFFNYEPGVYRYELKPGGAVETVLEPVKGVDTWLTDNAGTVRLGLGWRRKRLSIYYRDNGQDEFQRVARLKRGDQDSFFDALELISGSSKGYVLDENDEGRVGLRVFDYKTREVVDTFYENPNWDIEDVWLDKDGEPLAAFYTDDRLQAVWFDEDYKSSHKLLQKALSGSEVWILARSDNGRQMLVSAGNEADPGVMYFFDADTRRLDEFAQYRPEIDFRLLVKPKPITFTARDGTDIRAYLTLPKNRTPRNLPLIILPHGGPFGIRDSLRYDDQVQFLANRGYAVLQPNFRGSGGYGTAFYDLGIGQVGRGMQDDLDDAMDWAVQQGIADPARVCLVGGSYGGYAALWGVLRNPERYVCAASWAGVTDWTLMLRYDRRVMTRQAGKRWSAKIEGDDEEFDLKDVSPYRLARELRRPVLLAHGTADDNVPFEQYERMLKAARRAPGKLTTLVIEGEGHGFSTAENEQQWYDALDLFLAEHNPADQVDALGKLKSLASPADSAALDAVVSPSIASGE
ncbi:MAG: S9 family peptidase [Pseudomonadota bacterium]